MFDDLDKNSAPQNASREAPTMARTEDIFEEVDKTVKPEVFRPRPANTPPPYTPVIPEEQTWKNKKWLIFGSLLAVFVLIIGGVFGLKLMANNNAAPVNTSIQTEVNNTENTAAESVVPTQPAVTTEVTQPLDSDLDSLTDEEEISLGTDPNNSDTDSDGLTDFKEIKVYKTNPINSDTDSDGFNDGDEIKNGYNPNGSGKLLEINNGN